MSISEKEFNARRKVFIKEITRLLIGLKEDICDEYRASEEDTTPGMQVTIGCNDDCENWSYQTGDNSYTGGAYCCAYWGLIYLYRRSNSHELAIAGVDEMMEQIEIDAE